VLQQLKLYAKKITAHPNPQLLMHEPFNMQDHEITFVEIQHYKVQLVSLDSDHEIQHYKVQLVSLDSDHDLFFLYMKAREASQEIKLLFLPLEKGRTTCVQVQFWCKRQSKTIVPAGQAPSPFILPTATLQLQIQL
jgi:hypothetical protein